MQFEIRAAAPAEAAAMSELAVRSKGHWGYDEAFLEACREELRVDPVECDGVHVGVAVGAGDATLLGFYRLAGQPPVGELADLFVDPPAIGRGAGRALLAAALTTAARLGFVSLTIDADPHALAFYLHAGAVQVGDVASGSIEGRRLPRLELSVPSMRSGRPAH